MYELKIKNIFDMLLTRLGVSLLSILIVYMQMRATKNIHISLDLLCLSY